MAKNGIAKGLNDILLQGLGSATDGGGSSKAVERQQVAAANLTAREAEKAEKDAAKDAKDAAKAAKKGEVGTSTGIDIIRLSGVSQLVATGGAGDDILTGTDTIDTLFGAGGNDILIGFDNQTDGTAASLGDSLYGGDGNDQIFGGSGRDFVFGGLNDDTLEGNAGDDYIEGGSGTDLINDGGTGVTYATSVERLVSTSSGGATTETSAEHTDELAHGAPLPTGGYVMVWGQGIGADQAPTQAMKFARFDALGNMIGSPVRFDTLHPGLGPFEFKGEGKVVALEGANSGRFAIVIESEFFHGIGDNKSHTYLYVFNADGSFVKSTQLSDNIGQTQLKPTVTATSDGGVMVAWQDNWKDGGGSPPGGAYDAGIYMRKYSLAGATLSPVGINDIHVNQTTTGNQTSPEMHKLSNGNVLVAWNSTQNGHQDVFLRIFDQAGNPLAGAAGNEILASSTHGLLNQSLSNKNLSNLANGNFVLVYTSDDHSPVDNLPGNENDTDPSLIPRPEGQNGTLYFKVFTPGGAVVGVETAVATGDIQDATVTYLPDGGFVVVWSRDVNPAAGANNTNYDIFGQRYNANGTAAGTIFQINTPNELTGESDAPAATTYLEDQRRPHLMTLPNGTVVITWDSGKDPSVTPTRDEEIVQRIVRFGSSGGNDTMIGGSGADMVFGESGNDILFAGVTASGTSSGDFIDVLLGGSGRDVLNPDSGADSIFGGIGAGSANDATNAADYVRYLNSAAAVNVNLDDNLTETGGNAQGDFITGVEHVIGSGGNDSLTGIGTLKAGQEAFALNNSLVGAGGDDRVFGLDGNDSLFGDFLPADEAGTSGGGNDSLFGGSGADAMFGGTANDFLQGGAGADNLNGGNGLDTADYSNSDAAVVVDLVSGTGSGGHAQGDVLSNIENLIGGSSGDVLAGTDGVNTILGNSGGDNISGRGGNDSLYGGSGADAIAGEAGDDTIYGGTGNDANVFGGANNDTVRGDEGDDQLGGGLGADSLAGGTGNDLLVDGGDTNGDRYEGEGAGFNGVDAGQDTVSYINATTGVIANLTSGLGTNNDATGDTYSGIEHLIGGGGGDTLIGSAVVNSLVGNGGDDTLAGLAGGDSLFGGANTAGVGGGDWANYSASGDSVKVNLSDNVTELGGDAAGDFLTGVENVYGSNSTSGGDTLIGTDADANSLVGLAGFDTLLGLNGNDRLFGGDDDDTLVGGAGGDIMDGGNNGASKVNGDYAAYHASATRVDVDLTRVGATQSGGDAASDSLVNIEHLIGSNAGGDVLAGDANVNTLIGLGGIDTLFGRDGDDRLFGDSLDGSGGATDTLFGGSGLDALNGQDGDDTLHGGADADALGGGAGSDWASWENSGARVEVNLSDLLAESGGDAQGDVLSAVENLIGSSFNDILTGSANNNSIRGNDGDDTIVGGSGGGIDSIFGEVGNDTLIDNGGTGGDRFDGGKGTDVISYVNELTGVVVNLATGSGSDAAGVVAGAATGDSYLLIENIIGGLGNDTLIGAADVNTIVAGLGNDTLQGGDLGDSLDGGGGELDWVDYRDSNTAGVTVTLGLAGAQVSGGFANGDVIVNVENLRGSNLDDTLASNLSDTGTGNNIIDGALGDDTLIANSGIETFFGGAGSDWLNYSAAEEVSGIIVNLITGQGQGDLAEDDRYGTENGTGSGIENVVLGNGDDTIFGVIGVNVGTGQGGFNTFVGHSGNDLMYGGSSRDFLRGDDGNDTLNGGSGGDTIVGGTGVNDFADYAGTNTAGVTIDLETGRGSGGDAQGIDGFFDTLFGIEHLIGSGAGDRLLGDNGINWLFGATGNDTLIGRGSAGDLVTHDTIFGGDGNDRMGGLSAGVFDTGIDSLFGGTGNDQVVYDQNDAAISGGIGLDTLMGGSGVDQIQLDAARFNFAGGFADIETYDLGDGNDVFLNSSSAADLVNIGAGMAVFGGTGADQISMRGQAGFISGMDDFVDGGAGNDIIWGGFGNDSLTGSNGDDNLYGGKGNDRMTGDKGFDIFYVGHDEGNDTLFDDPEETNGLVLFWGWDSTFGGNFDGLDPSEVTVDYSDPSKVVITMQNGGQVEFDRVHNKDGTWSSSIDIINLWDYGQGEAGNSPTPPSQFQRDVWSATFDTTTGQFHAQGGLWTLAVNG